MDHLVEVDNLTFKRADRVIYDGISLKVPKGKITAVMGPSGIGKTTLLRLIGGQLTPDEGDVRFDGDSIVSMSRKSLYNTRRRMSMLFQSGALFTDMSVFDNVAFPLREHTKLSEDIIATCRFKATGCGIARCRSTYAKRIIWWYGAQGCTCKSDSA